MVHINKSLSFEKKLLLIKKKKNNNSPEILFWHAEFPPKWWKFEKQSQPRRVQFNGNGQITVANTCSKVSTSDMAWIS